jgi:hypothetical protein
MLDPELLLSDRGSFNGELTARTESRDAVGGWGGHFFGNPKSKDGHRPCEPVPLIGLLFALSLQSILHRWQRPVNDMAILASHLAIK